MGSGYWTRESFERYNASRGRTVNAAGHLDSKLTDQQIFTQRVLSPKLNPKNVVRECCDSAEHPNTIPVILALDVTGSMGPASAEVAKKMNEVMTRLYDQIEDVEFMVMGIGDLAYDRAPIQISQFESDIRIAEQLDLVYMEHGGGGNAFESYTAAWYMGVNHCKLDCWKRGKRGLIITMGDEPLNPYLPKEPLAAVTGDALQADVETRALYEEAIRKYDIYHLHVNHRNPDGWWPQAEKAFNAQLEQGHLRNVTIQEISGAIIDIVKAHAEAQKAVGGAVVNAGGEIRWSTDAPTADPAPETPVPEGPGEISWEVGGEKPAEAKEPEKKKGLFRHLFW